MKERISFCGALEAIREFDELKGKILQSRKTWGGINFKKTSLGNNNHAESDKLNDRTVLGFLLSSMYNISV